MYFADHFLSWASAESVNHAWLNVVQNLYVAFVRLLLPNSPKFGSQNDLCSCVSVQTRANLCNRIDLIVHYTFISFLKMFQQSNRTSIECDLSRIINDWRCSQCRSRKCAKFITDGWLSFRLLICIAQTSFKRKRFFYWQFTAKFSRNSRLLNHHIIFRLLNVFWRFFWCFCWILFFLWFSLSMENP